MNQYKITITKAKRNIKQADEQPTDKVFGPLVGIRIQGLDFNGDGPEFFDTTGIDGLVSDLLKAKAAMQAMQGEEIF